MKLNPAARIAKVIADETTTNKGGEVVWIAKKDRAPTAS